MQGLAASHLGSGPEQVVLVHDWLGDHRNYDAMRPYLDTLRFTYSFVDLRAIGLSRDIGGAYSLEEAAAKVLAFIEVGRLGPVHLVGHSMSSLVVQHAVKRAPGAVRSLALLTPLGPDGLGAGPEVVAALEDMGRNPRQREGGLAAQWGMRNGAGWLRYKLRRWEESAYPEAVAGYVTMFCASPFAMPRQESLRVLAVTGAHDGPAFLADAVKESLAPIYPNLQLEDIGVAGHYPMEEAPVQTAKFLMDFFGA